jgi:hypothetical protein
VIAAVQDGAPLGLSQAVDLSQQRDAQRGLGSEEKVRLHHASGGQLARLERPHVLFAKKLD